MGGENAYRQTVPGLGLGSPPRRRGKGRLCSLEGAGEGITPAWAGKRPSWQVWKPDTKDYPRVGGEKSFTRLSIAATRGSPPRRRGKANWHCVRRPALRITPAQAGKSHVLRFGAQVLEDHPRVGGEKWLATKRKWSVTGSPPRRRGKAGHQSNQQTRCKDHPRVGGKK